MVKVESSAYIIAAAAVTIVFLFVFVGAMAKILISRFNEFVNSVNVHMQDLTSLKVSVEYIKNDMSDVKQAGRNASLALERIAIVEKEMKTMWIRIDEGRRMLHDYIRGDRHE